MKVYSASKKEGNYDTHYYRDDTWRHYTKWKKSVTKRKILNYLTYMTYLGHYRDRMLNSGSQGLGGKEKEHYGLMGPESQCGCLGWWRNSGDGWWRWLPTNVNALDATGTIPLKMVKIVTFTLYAYLLQWKNPEKHVIENRANSNQKVDW